MNETSSNNSTRNTSLKYAVIPCVLFVLLASLSWRRTLDPIVDSGRELYVPWQLSEGAILYQDIAYFNGPFSPYLNAGLFRVFGAAISTLLLANLVIAGTLAILTFRWVRWSAGPGAAAFAVCVLMLVFQFRVYDALPNYTYALPYSHEMTHGLLLAVLTLSAMAVLLVRQSSWSPPVGGFLFGCLFLTKPELFLATAVATTVACIAALIQDPPRRKLIIPRLLTFLAATALTFLTSVLLLSTQMPLTEAARHCCGGWQWVLSPEVTQQPFYKLIQGTLDPGASARRWAVGLATAAILLAAIILLSRRFKNALPLIFAALVVACTVWPSRFPVLLTGPVVATAIGIIFVAGGLRLIRDSVSQKNTTPPSHRQIITLMWSAFGATLLAKQFLAPRVIHYGFVLAAPAAMIAITALWRYSRTADSEHRAVVPRMCVIALLVISVDSFACVRHSLGIYMARQQAIGLDEDQLLAFPACPLYDAEMLNELLREGRRTFPENATIAVMPEGVTVNYMLRRANSTPFINLMPIEMAMYGEPNIEASFRSHPPDYIVVVHRATDEYGVPPFGHEGYGHGLMNWVDTEYDVIRTIGSPPQKSDEFGIRILQRRESRSASAESVRR